MSKTYNFGRTFKTSVQNGKTPYSVVENIASKYRKTPAFVWANLKKNGYAFCTKFNGKSFWFPTFSCKTNSKNWKKTEATIWPQFIQYALQQGWITPAQCYNWTTNQICYHISNCFSKCYSKPGNFNPNTRNYKNNVPGQNGNWTTNGTWNNTTKSNTGTKKNRKSRKATGKTTRTYKSKTRKTNKTRRTNTGLRLVGATGRTRRYGSTRRYGTRRYARRAA